jgi:hypothetical protein
LWLVGLKFNPHPTGKRERFWGNLNYVLDWELYNPLGFRLLYLCVVKKPFRKLLAFVGVTGEAFCFCIPLMAGRAGNF